MATADTPRDAGDRPDDPFLRRLFPGLLVRGVKWGLEKMEAILAELGNPHKAYATLHVGGTNGKGSTSAMLASVLAQCGHRVGLYTSPHLRHFSERIRVAGRPVSPDRLLAEAEELRPILARSEPTFFEAATVLAFSSFRTLQVDVAVIEVGLGGRLDATNVVRPLVTAVTNVAMDHSAYLGNTLEAVAREKAGIFKPEVPAVTAVEEPDLRALLKGEAEARSADLHIVDPTEARRVEISLTGTHFDVDSPWGPLELSMPLIGAHQVKNSLVALAVLNRLPDHLRPHREGVIAGMQEVRWPGRVQVERARGTRWIFDIAHNPASVEALVATLDLLHIEPTPVALVGVLGDKDWKAMLPPILDRVSAAVLTVPPSALPGRAWDPRAARESVGNASCAEVEPDFSLALERALALGQGGTVLVTGSSHTVGDALEILDLPA